MGDTTKRAYDKVGIKSRSMAFRIVLVFLIGTLVGSLLPETGTVLAHNLGIFSHIFNPFFLALGIIGIVLACYIGCRKSR